MLNDLRYAVRTLRKALGFTLVAILTLALGIGANTAMFSIVKAVLLAKLPYPNPDQIVQLWETGENNFHRGVSGPNFHDWKDQSKSFGAMATFAGDIAGITGDFSPQHVRVNAVSSEFFRVVGVNALHGSTLPPDVSKSAVIGYSLWQSAFQGSPQAVGKAISVYGSSFTVVGIMPPGFDFPQRTQIWMTYEFPGASARSAHNYRVVGRLKPGVSQAAAQADMNVVAGRLAKEYIDDKDHGIRVVSLHDELLGPVRPALLMLLAAVGFVLLIATVNIANLQLARSVLRIKEIALRSALGAGRRRLVRQLLTESLLLSTLGGLAGLLLAYWGVDVLRASIPPDIPRVENIHVDGWALAFTFALSGLAGVLFGLFPAWAASREHVNDALKEGSGKSTAGPGRRRLEGALVASEMGIAMVLLVGAALLIQSFWNLQHVDLGFQPSGMITADISWPVVGGSEANEGPLLSNTRQLLERVRAVPGVEAAGTTNTLPIADHGADGYFEIEGRTLPSDPHDSPDAWYRVVTPGYLESLGVSLKQGREFGWDLDRTIGPQVAIVNQAFAKRFYPGDRAIGKRIRFLGFDRHPQFMEIVGLVSDYKSDVRKAADPEVFVNGLQHPAYLTDPTLVVRGPATAVASIRSIISSISRDTPVVFKPMDDVISQSVSRQRFQTVLLAIFAGLALLLATVGIYGVLSYSVDRRTSEFGIRMALGAGRSRVLGMVMREALVLVATGLAIGVLAALLATRALASLLFGVAPNNPAAFVLTAIVLSAVGLLACYVPARRATKVDPMIALRYE